MVAGDVAAQTQRVMDNLRQVLLAAGCGFEDVVRSTIYVIDLAHFAVVNEVYGRAFRPPFPARATVQVSALPRGAQVEIDAIAVMPG
jgi:2-iminobutanoate/2-iminopropanoate deaminase